MPPMLQQPEDNTAAITASESVLVKRDFVSLDIMDFIILVGCLVLIYLDLNTHQQAEMCGGCV